MRPDRVATISSSLATVAAREKTLLAAVKVGESEVTLRTNEASAKAEDLAACEAALTHNTEEARVKAEEIPALETTVEILTDKVRQKAEMLAASEAALVKTRENCRELERKRVPR